MSSSLTEVVSNKTKLPKGFNRRDSITILPADDPAKMRLGWIIFETDAKAYQKSLKKAKKRCAIVYECSLDTHERYLNIAVQHALRHNEIVAVACKNVFVMRIDPEKIIRDLFYKERTVDYIQ